MLMLDICCGFGGASAAFRARGWDVVSVDIEPLVKPDVICDVRFFTWHGSRPDLIWCSPPCTEFARIDNFPGRDFPEPDMSIYLACKRIISEAKPRYWVIENVRGAIPYFGQPAYSHRPQFLWGFFPDLGRVVYRSPKNDVSGKNRPEGMGYKQGRALNRAVIPYPLSAALCRAVEIQPVLFEVSQW